MAMKFIVTGGAGFIGHNVVSILEAMGHQCIVIDNFTDYGFVPQDELAYLTNERLRRFNSPVIRADILDEKKIKNVFDKHKDAAAVIHLASFPRQKIVSQNPLVASNVMSTGLINLCLATKNSGIKKFVYISSSMVYGDFNHDVSEESVCNPIGQYGIMKYMGEWLVKDFARQGHFDYTIIRPSAVYGEYDVEDRVVSKFMLAAMRGQTLTVKGANEVLDFTYVEDTAMGIALAATKTVANNKIYNITRADTKLYTLKMAAEIAVSIAGKGSIKEEGRDLEFPSRGRLSIDRANSELGYAPKVNVEQGFLRYHEWFKKSSYWSKLL
jgi:nucleoside-diphosphate-sugar epimerase